MGLAGPLASHGCCFGNIDHFLKPGSLLEGASLDVRRWEPCSAEARRQMWVAWRTGLPGTWLPMVHANCQHNEIAALALRSLAPLPDPDPVLSPDIVAAYSRLRVLARAYRGRRWSLLETALSYTGGLRRRYLEAERSLRDDGELSKLDWSLRAFLKAEKTSAAKDAKPRMIFPRSPRFNLVVASWLKPFEHWLWGYLTARRLFGGSNTRVVGKGLSPGRRARLIKRKFDAFKDCVVFEVDGRAFEAHVTVPHLQQEHSIYMAAYPGHAGLRKVLGLQRFEGETAGGVKFAREGGRASGDFNTGMGNTLVMLGVCVGVLNRYRVKYDLLVDGDNALVFLGSADAPRVIHNFHDDALAASGFEMTLEQPVTILEEVRFGRSAPVFNGWTWTMVRDPRSVLSGAYASHRWLREPVFGRRWVNGVARCELSLARGLPVLQAAALSVLTQTRSGKKVPVEALSDYFVVGAWLAEEEDAVPVGPEARSSFERAFGLSPEEQMHWESVCCRTVVGHSAGTLVVPSPSRWREADPGVYESYWDHV